MTKKTTPLRDLLNGKDAHQAAPGDTIRSVAIEMPRTHSSAAVVLDSKGKLIGILTEKDIVERAIGARRNVDKTTVEEIMTRDPVTISVKQPISKALLLMTQKGVRTLPVMDGQKFIGIIDIRDLYAGMNKLLEDQLRTDKSMIAYAFGEDYGIDHAIDG